MRGIAEGTLDPVGLRIVAQLPGELLCLVGCFRLQEQTRTDRVLQGERNTEDVDKALAALVAAKPEAIYLQAVKKPAVAFLKKAAAKGFKPLILTSSVVGTIDMLDSVSVVLGDLRFTPLLRKAFGISRSLSSRAFRASF